MESTEVRPRGNSVPLPNIHRHHRLVQERYMWWEEKPGQGRCGNTCPWSQCSRGQGRRIVRARAAWATSWDLVSRRQCMGMQVRKEEVSKAQGSTLSTVNKLEAQLHCQRDVQRFSRLWPWEEKKKDKGLPGACPHLGMFGSHLKKHSKSKREWGPS